MNNSIYQLIVDRAAYGYACHRIILDDGGAARDYEYLDVNDAFCEQTGLERHTVIGRRVTEIIPGITRDRFNWISFYGAIALGGPPREFEQYFAPFNRWYRIQAFSPEPMLFVTLFTEITGEKNADEILRASEARMRQYVDNAPDGIFVVDESGVFREVNPAGCRMLGYSEDTILGKSIADVTPPAWLAHNLERFRAVKERGFDSGEIVLAHQAGRLVPIAIDSVALPDNRYMGFCRDITARRNAERARELYHRAMQSVTQPIAITDVDGDIIEVNDAFCAMYGYRREEVVGRNPSVLNPGREVYINLGYTDAQYQALFAEMWNAIRDPARGSWEDVVINRRKDGSLVWAKLLITAVRGEDGSLQNFIGMPIDISQSRERENLSRVQLYQTIADLSELRDNETGNHMRRVGILARMIAKAHGMPEKYCDDISVFAPMHDIGKVGILDSILLAERKLTVEEFEEMKKHTVLGWNIVKGKAELEMVAAITLCHHEKWNGTGYPRGLSGETIPLSARITTIADVYDALRSKRPYKDPGPMLTRQRRLCGSRARSSTRLLSRTLSRCVIPLSRSISNLPTE